MIHYFTQNEVSGERDCFLDIAFYWDGVSLLPFLIVCRSDDDVETTITDTTAFEEREKRVVMRNAPFRLNVSLGVDGRVGGDRRPSTQPHPRH